MVKKDFLGTVGSAQELTIPLDTDITGTEVKFILLDAPGSTIPIFEKNTTPGLTIINEDDGIVQVNLSALETAELLGYRWYKVILNDTVTAGYGTIIYQEDTEIGTDPNGETVECHSAIIDNKLFIVLDEELTSNYDYILTIKSDIKDTNGTNLAEDYQLKFSSSYDPMAASPITIQNELSQYLDITSYSLFDVCMNIRANTFLLKTLTKRTDIDWDNPPTEVKEYLKNKAVYDLVLSNGVNSASGSGDKITLGPMAVSKSGFAPGSLTELVATLRSKLQPWYDICIGKSNRGEALLQTVARAGSYEGTFNGDARRWA